MEHSGFRLDEKSCQGDSNFQIYVSEALEDLAWDSFLQNTPSGHHVQSSSWARLKDQFGFHFVRIMAKKEERLVAGAQLLVRRIPCLGSIAYIPRGPLFSIDDPALINLVINKICLFCRENKFLYLAIQPPIHGEPIVHKLLEYGFSQSAIEFVPSASVILDLFPELEVIFRKMDREARRNIRQGLRKGIAIREGSEEDIHVFYRLLISTGNRQKFPIYPERYYLEMWHSLASRGNLKLFLADYKDDVVSAQLAVPFGDTVLNKMSVWSGKHGNLYPNEVLQWTVIVWAKSHGYRYYDFEGIDSHIAKGLLSNKISNDSIIPSVTSFKLKFGGEVVLFPSAYDYIYNPFLRWTYNNLVSRFVTSLSMKHLINYNRSRS